MEPNQNRMKLLIRMQQGRRMEKELAQRMSEVCGETIEIEFLDLIRTDAFKEKFYDILRSKEKLGKTIESKEQVLVVLNQLKMKVAKSAIRVIYSFHQELDSAGAILVGNEFFCRNIESIWNVVGPKFSVANVNLSSGFSLEKDFYDDLGNYFRDGVYTLHAWGEWES